MHSNHFKVLYYNKKGLELDTFMRRVGDKLNNTRIFYIISTKVDDYAVWKIGLSERGANSSFGRLKDYVHNFGKTDKDHPCRGVKIYVCLSNRYNVDVSNPNAAVRKLETKMKRDFKDKMVRGNERIGYGVTIDEIFSYLESNEFVSHLEDTERPVRQTPRLKEKNQGANDAVDKIVDHDINRRGDVIFEVQFKETIVYDSNQSSSKKRLPNKKLKYDELIEYRNGKTRVDEYLKNLP